jgi:hypothetical protein
MTPSGYTFYCGLALGTVLGSALAVIIYIFSTFRQEQAHDADQDPYEKEHRDIYPYGSRAGLVQPYEKDLYPFKVGREPPSTHDPAKERR